MSLLNNITATDYSVNTGLRWVGHDLVFHLLKPSIILNGGSYWLHWAVYQPEREGSEVTVVPHLVRRATSRVVDGVRDQPHPLLPSSIWNIKRGIYPTHPLPYPSTRLSAVCVCEREKVEGGCYVCRDMVFEVDRWTPPLSLSFSLTHTKISLWYSPTRTFTFYLPSVLRCPCRDLCKPTLYQTGQAYGEGERERESDSKCERERDVNQRAATQKQTLDTLSTMSPFHQICKTLISQTICQSCEFVRRSQCGSVICRSVSDAEHSQSMFRTDCWMPPAMMDYSDTVYIN